MIISTGSVLRGYFCDFTTRTPRDTIFGDDNGSGTKRKKEVKALETNKAVTSPQVEPIQIERPHHSPTERLQKENEPSSAPCKRGGGYVRTCPLAQGETRVLEKPVPPFGGKRWGPYFQGKRALSRPDQPARPPGDSPSESKQHDFIPRPKETVRSPVQGDRKGG
jgi:hypothetical protein